MHGLNQRYKITKAGIWANVFYFTCALILVLSPLPANANWKEVLGTFRIGVVISGNTSEALAKMEPFRLAVAEKLEIPVEILPSRDLGTLVRNHIEGRNEYAILSASAYGAAWAACECVEPLVVAKSFDGSSATNSILISRKNSKITAPKDAVGKKIVALGSDSIMGYALAVHELQIENVDLLDSETEFLFFPSAEEALTAFANGQGDVLIGWTSNIGDASTGYTRGSLTQLYALEPALLDNVNVIWSSSAVPHRLHSIRKNLDGEPKRLIRELMLDMFAADPVAYDSIEPDYSGGFQAIEQNKFSRISAFAKSPVPQKKSESANAVLPELKSKTGEE